jgi:hypothetical protein
VIAATILASGSGGISTNVILAIVALIGLLATAAAAVGGSFKVSNNTATISRYREAAQAWETKSRAQDAEILELQRVNIANDKKISELEARVTILQDLVTGKSAVDLIEAKSTELKDLINKTYDAVAQLATRIDQS